MLSTNLIRNSLAVSAAIATIALLAPGAAVAQPSTGSADDVISGGSGILDGGSSVLDGDIADGAAGIVDSGSSILNSLPGTGSFAPRQLCNQDTVAGGPGVTQTNHDLGRPGPNSFVLRYETINIPDIIDVFYQGALIYSTGYVGDNINEGTGSVVVNVPPGTDTSVLVKVTGPGGTDWDYTVGCPIA
ncbi:MAG: hypothetical protein WBD41_24475 [Rhodococcus sp. (in: high G+C Gram-positive bacteria)]|jgi:hypothetical protein|uniref:hypothetical protein n=1 Tax=Rhodococcus sp. EPR-157 TaxID=1813677 RepID=UPI0007BB1664|nr:hypothetical protein [Rhodococcus sp. EPR-157]KZF10496.1 hypothetical protein A2J03_00555 [Rhodococcus sp. EPR-157]